jgi:hypothetical protein
MSFSTTTSGLIILPLNSLTCASTGIYVQAPPKKKKRKKRKAKKPVSMYCRVVEP